MNKIELSFVWSLSAYYFTYLLKKVSFVSYTRGWLTIFSLLIIIPKVLNSSNPYLTKPVVSWIPKMT